MNLFDCLSTTLAKPHSLRHHVSNTAECITLTEQFGVIVNSLSFGFRLFLFVFLGALQLSLPVNVNTVNKVLLTDSSDSMLYLICGKQSNSHENERKKKKTLIGKRSKFCPVGELNVAAACYRY